MDDTETFARVLRRSAVPLEEVERRYPGPAGLVQRILGVLPNALSLFEIWPPALVTFNLTIPALLDVPKSDIGLGLSPELRAMIAHAASLSFNCRYCAAHTAIMGTVVGGPADGLTVSGRIAAVRAPGDLTRPEQLAVNFASAAAQVPSAVTPEMLVELSKVQRTDRVESIALVIAAMGYMNRSMDALGTPLETAIAEAAGPSLREGGWDPGKHHDPEAKDADARAGRSTLGIRSRARLAVEVPRAIAYEKQALANIPSGTPEQVERLAGALGFVPYFIPQIQRANARRVFVHWLLERIDQDGVDADKRVKYTMGWVMARAAENRHLAAHFAFGAIRNGATPASLNAALNPPRTIASKEDAVSAFTHGVARTSTALPNEVVRDVDRELSAPGIVELIVVASIVCALQRYTAAFPTAQMEPEIEAFLGQHADVLGL